jgi:hypothetical protein
MVGDVTFWYQSIVTTLSLNGPDRWSLDSRFKWKLCLEEPISNLKMFLSAQRITLVMLRSSEGEAYRKTTTEVVLDRRVM